MKTSLFRHLCLVLALACALLGRTVRASTPSTLYVSCNGSDNVQVLSTAGTPGAAIPITSPATPAAVALDRAGNLYVANNHSPYSIEYYSPSGDDLGSFTTTTTNLNKPEGLAFDGAGNLYVANYGTNTIEKYSSAGVDMGVFVSTGLKGPVGLAFDLGYLYVVNANANTISKFSASGDTLVATYSSSNLNIPFRIAFDAAHNFYVTDIQANLIEKFSSAGVDQNIYATAGLNEPTGLAFDTDGTLYVCNANALNIEKYSSTGADEGSIGNLPAGSEALDIALLASGGQFEFSSATYSTSENAGNVTITVNRANGSRGATSVTYTTTDGTAKANTDYNATSGTLTWEDGDSASQSFTVPIIDRGITTGGSFAFGVALTDPITGTGTFGMPASATVTINDNDMAGVLQFSADAYTTFEDAGSVMVTVSRVDGSTGAVSVNYATGGGTAVVGTDYTETTGTLNWAGGDMAAKTFTVPILNHGVTSGSVNFGVSLSDAVGTALGTPASASVTINDNDMASGGQIEFSSATYQTYQDAGSVTITINRVDGASGATSVTYTTTDGTAQAGTDYTQTSGTLNWADGDAAAKSFTVPIIDHGVTSGSVNFGVTFLTISGLATIGTPASATVTITDNDMPPAGVLQFSASTYQTYEDAGTASITVSRTGGSSGAVSVVYTTTDGTALAGTDYTAATGILTWADGDATSKIIAVPILDRHITSATPVAFNVTLGLPTGGATLGTPNPATVSISDNDAPTKPTQPTVTLAYSESVPGEPPNTIPVGRVVQFFADISDPSNQLKQVQFTLDGAVIGTLSNDGGLYAQSVTFPDRGTHTVETIATSLQGGMSTSAATFTVYAEPTITYCTAPPSITIGEQSPFQIEFSVYDPDNQVAPGQAYFEGYKNGQYFRLITSIGADGNYVLSYPLPDGTYIQTVLGTGTFQLEPFVDTKDNSSIVSGIQTTVTITDTGSTSGVSVGATATFLAGIDKVNVPAGDVLSVVLMTTSEGGTATPLVTRVDFYVDGVLFASVDGDGNPIPLSARAPGRGPITRAASAAGDAAATGSKTLFEATYQVPANSQTVTITAVATTSDGLSHLTAPLHVTPVVETGTPPVATLGPLTGGKPVPARASLVVPVKVSAPSIPVALVQYYLNGALVSASTGSSSSVTLTPRIAGPYALTAVVTDTNGVSTFANPLAFEAVPTVGLSVKGAGRAVVDGEEGEVLFTRKGGNLSAPLTVFFKLTGTAKDGANYDHIGRKVVIPAGKATYKLKIKARDTKKGPLELKLDIKLLASPDGNYAIGHVAQAKLMIEQTQ